MTVAGIEDRDWSTSWRQFFRPQRITDRLMVLPAWDDLPPDFRGEVIRMDPGPAFGTGQHPTTRMCLEEVERRVAPGVRLLDLGTGSGILSIAAVKLGAASALALDLDSVAVQAARANCRHNSVSRKVAVLQGTLPHPRARSGGFDLV
ncbi:MAG: 50S ribosomal protein L11 methyltransferase, partial [Proteobacteria bacterium]|nr:50S ribosomal protein L11 methyltransferase [Pseudomonadota bacterium]